MGMRRLVYLDNHATTQPDPRVVEAMLPYFRDQYGNAASAQHEFGWAARAAVDIARGKVAKLIGADASEIIFTSGATESINLALKGAADAYLTLTGRPGHMIATAAEHRAVLDAGKRLEQRSVSVTILPVDRYGRVDPAKVQESITGNTLLVSVILANNEIGTIAYLNDIADVCRSHGLLLHTDATQAVGKIPLSVSQLSVDLMSFSAHKMYGPKGIGALFVGRNVNRERMMAQIDGGGHESRLRSGTLNVPGIVGFGLAAEIAGDEMAGDSTRTRSLRELLLTGLRNALDNLHENGDVAHRLPHNASITFAGAPADHVLMKMRDVAVSSGSACSSASPEPSHVLRAIGLSDGEAKSTLRFGLGRFTTEDDIAYATTRIVEAVRTCRSKRYLNTAKSHNSISQPNIIA